MHTAVNTLLKLSCNGVPGVELDQPIGDILRNQHRVSLLSDEFATSALAYIEQDALFWLSVGNELEKALNNGLLGPMHPTIVASTGSIAKTNVLDTCRFGIETDDMPRGLLMQSRSTCCDAFDNTLRWCPHGDDGHCADLVARALVRSPLFRQRFIALAQTKHHITLHERKFADSSRRESNDARKVYFMVSLV